MRIVVSDAEPLIHLAQINKLHLLKKLFGTVLIIHGVKSEAVDEGIKLGHPDALVVKEAVEEGWIVAEGVSEEIESVAKRLAKGENLSQSDAETILLARERQAEAVLVDEKTLSDLAKMYGLKVWNTWTILLEALGRGFIEVSDIEFAVNELGRRRHKLRVEQVAEILEAARRVASTRPSG